MLLTPPLMVVGFISFARVFTQWQSERWRAGIPLVSCILAVVIAPDLGSGIRSLMFKWSLPRYEALIHRIESGNVRVSNEWQKIEEANGLAPYGVAAKRGSNDVLMVEFRFGAGFPVKHSAYLYCSSGVIDHSEYRRGYAIRPKWFQVSD